MQNPQIIERHCYIRQVRVGIPRCQLTISLQCLLIGRARLRHPVLIAMQNPQIIERHCYIRQVRVGIPRCQLTISLQCLLIGRARLRHPVLIAMQNPQIVERHCHTLGGLFPPCQLQATLVRRSRLCECILILKKVCKVTIGIKTRWCSFRCFLVGSRSSGKIKLQCEKLASQSIFFYRLFCGFLYRSFGCFFCGGELFLQFYLFEQFQGIIELAIEKQTQRLVVQS